MNYYDSYDFLSIFTAHSDSLAYRVMNGYDNKYQGAGDAVAARGMLTGTATRVLNTSGNGGLLVRSMYYDLHGNLVQSHEQNHLGGYEHYYYPLTFTGKPLKVMHVHTTPDPLAEKYFHISPFAYCANNPIRYTDPTGEEKIISYNPHDEEHENNDTPKYMAKIYPDDDAIHIFAHGSKKGIWIYRDGKDVLINNSDDFQALLSEKSFIWRNRKNGEKITIILHSCKTGYGEDSFAERMSKELENTTIIAPNENLVQNKYSGLNAVFETEIIGDGKNKWANPIRQGQWKVFEEGKVIATYLGIWKPKLPTSFIDNFYKINK